jgi:hypothetical protein
MTKKIVILALVLIVAALGIWVNWRPSSFPPEAVQELDDFVQRFAGPSFGYKIVSAEKGAMVRTDNTDKLEAAPFGQVQKPAGVCPPDEPQVKENWCVIVDKPIETSEGVKSTHFIAQRQGQLWIVQEVPDSDADVFRQFGCRKW